MRILYDGFIYSVQTAGGINRYFSKLIEGLSNKDVPMLTVTGSRKLNFPSHANLELYDYNKFHFRPMRISQRLNLLLLNRYMSNNKIDVIHPTYYSTLMGIDLKKQHIPIVITVHDMIHEVYPELIDPDRIHARIKENAIMSASAIICVSENTKRDLLHFYPVDEDIISVIYHGSGIVSKVKKESRLHLEPYFLYVGSRSPYKNFNGLLKEFIKVVSVVPTVSLIVAGALFTDDERKVVRDLGLSKCVKEVGYVSDEKLANLYQNSIAFVYPSLYEGFGIPLLEAMAYNTVVVASNTSCIPEVVGDAGLLFDPTKTGELANILIRLYENPVIRDEFILKGQNRLLEFSWKKTVEETKQVYESLILK